ncbi:hypothetical protein PHYSODRAFT_351516 [Phytophthora sojae]|uniref:RxLR effector protein n=2 Tax=Phytophthora sojae TaxID=67593 RepID=G4ZN60_PHYSP|nr:hypothetical protein PHYSODRAFT_351516 [Phytophthora sojae]AEK80942.1 Avh215 [Phytophthora sojae]AEK80943.1 Avh215 [Phytophthora sojae]AEK80944.1 Avh215 [Phytophthora sojae]EGZ15383.1 hypothetical protein PHYSODRAFT_351516 [Phytophthora sojae]|eukprot:XP_009529132.1 hypothetical protein PHYSODRAFT_351516 [Phytophthora sojae]
MSANINRATSSIILLAVLLLCVCVGVDAACSKVVAIEHSTLFGGQGGQDGGHVNRHLRAGVKKYGDRDDRDEERAIGSTTDWLVASTKKLWGKRSQVASRPRRQTTFLPF